MMGIATDVDVLAGWRSSSVLTSVDELVEPTKLMTSSIRSWVIWCMSRNQIRTSARRR
jgi:hypothetical protein